MEVLHSLITPEQIHTVNDPIAHYLGTLSITGSLTCYLNGDTNSSLKLLTDSLTHNDTVNSNALNVTIGAAAGPNLKIKVDNAHIDINLINKVQIDNGGAMYPLKNIFIQFS